MFAFGAYGDARDELFFDKFLNVINFALMVVFGNSRSEGNFFRDGSRICFLALILFHIPIHHSRKIGNDEYGYFLIHRNCDQVELRVDRFLDGFL